MDQVLTRKIKETIRHIQDIWSKLKDYYSFIAFSTGKDSLALTAIMYEALDNYPIECIYSHHPLEFPENLDYANKLIEKGFNIKIRTPFLNYFELMDRGISFLTLYDPWCVPYLVGTALLEWLQEKGASSAKQGVMFRGMSGSEVSHKWHSKLELYSRLNLPCFNPLLNYIKEEIFQIIKFRYNLPLNPIYNYMDRSYCICCYTSDKKRQNYSIKNFPDIYNKYYQQIESLLFDSGLINKCNIEIKYKSKEEKLIKHGFIYWKHSKKQDTVSALKIKISKNVISYQIKDKELINVKHLKPLKGNWLINDNEIRFWNVPERVTDILIKRMINCLDCGFCVVECFLVRKYDRLNKSLIIGDCIKCGKCLTLKYCMGWKHRFWRRTISEAK